MAALLFEKNSQFSHPSTLADMCERSDKQDCEIALLVLRVAYSFEVYTCQGMRMPPFL